MICHLIPAFPGRLSFDPGVQKFINAKIRSTKSLIKNVSAKHRWHYGYPRLCKSCLA